MKKHLFLLSSVFALLSLQAQKATMMIAENTNVKVKFGTTLYVGGEMKVANYTESGRKISNQGNIKITEKLTNENTNTSGQKDGSNFVNEIAGAGKYGQLIINNNASKVNDGRIASQVNLNRSSNFIDIAVPYKGITAGHLVKEAFGTSRDVSSAFIGYVAGRSNTHPVYDAERYNNPLFYWSNPSSSNDVFASVNVETANVDLINPERAYAFSSFSTLGNYNGAVKSLSGTPVKDNFPVEVKYYAPSNNKASNFYGEAYGSYITDFTLSPPLGWANYENGPVVQPIVESKIYGANIYYLGNPYTSNIDLSKGEGFYGTGTKVQAIYQTNSIDYNEDGNALSNTFQNYTFKGITGNGVGDEEAKFVRPFQTFAVKLNLSEGEKYTFTFKDEMKTFSLPNTKVINNVFQKSNNLTTPNQVAIELYDSNGATGVKTYIAAGNEYQAAEKGFAELNNPHMTDEGIGIYTLQENEDGTVNRDLSTGKTYINGVNETKYVAKPIHLVFQNGKGQYTFKANNLKSSLQSANKSFYFEDKKEGKVLKINKDFSYTFNVDGTEKDRFVIYWAALPTKEITKEVSEESVNTTVVFKDQNLFKIRFDKEIETADVFVYSISGQLINVDEKVNTSNDYIVPVLGNSNVYIVKIVGSNGKVITKKIIK